MIHIHTVGWREGIQANLVGETDMVGGAAEADPAIRGIVARNVCCWGALRVVALHH